MCAAAQPRVRLDLTRVDPLWRVYRRVFARDATVRLAETKQLLRAMSRLMFWVEDAAMADGQEAQLFQTSDARYSPPASDLIYPLAAFACAVAMQL